MKPTNDKLLKEINDAKDGTYIENAPDSMEDVNDGSVHEEDPELKVSDLWRDWEMTREFLDNKNVPNAVKQYEDYFEGRQDKYLPDSLPKIIINVVPMIVNNKLSNICENPIQLNYISNVDMASTMEMTRFSEYQLKNMGFERLLRRAVKWGLVRGTSVVHIYWNEDVIGKESIAQGSMMGEEINLLNLGLANPTERDIQRQEWIIIASRESVRKVKEMVEDQDQKDLIVPDDNEVNIDLIEQEGKNLCTVLTRYFRIDNEVYFEKGTKNVMLTEPIPLNPNLTLQMIKKNREKKNDAQTASSPDETLQKSNVMADHNKFHLYPVAICVLDESSDCYLGISDVDGIILGQNAINVMFALALKNGIDIQAKYLVKEDALRSQIITNEIGQVLTDYHKGQADGIHQMTGQAVMTNQMLELPMTLTEIIRKVKSASEVLTGDIAGKELSGNAIAMLQTAAEKPVENQERQVQLFAEECGRIFLLFYKFYFQQARFAYGINGKQRQELAQKTELPLDNIPDRMEGRFNGSKYSDTIFDIQVEAGSGGRFSQINQFNFINTFMTNSKNMTAREKRFYIMATPSSILKDKTDLLEMVDEEEQSENAQLKNKIIQMGEALKKYSAGSQELAAYLKYYKEYADALAKESGIAIEARDKAIKSLTTEKEVKKEDSKS